MNFEAEALGLERQHDGTGPHNVLRIELNEYAAGLARVTVWIGELQWRIDKGYAFQTRPVLEPLNHIECGDAVLNSDGREASWPTADVMIGNPTFGCSLRVSIWSRLRGRQARPGWTPRGIPHGKVVAVWATAS